MCEMVRSKFGIEYNTGELVKSETAEVLKVKSRLVAVKKDLKGHKQAVEQAKRQEAAYLAQLQENSIIIAQQDKQINENNDILLQQNQYIKKVSEDRPDPSEVNTADRKAVREYNKKVERWNKNVEGKYNGSIFDKNKEIRELTLVSNAQKKSTVSLEQRETSIQQREKQCLAREMNIDLEIQKRLEAELERAALYKRLMQINEEWETRYAEIYRRTKSQARYLTELAHEQSQETAQERTEINADKHTEEKQNNHSRTDPETFDGR